MQYWRVGAEGRYYYPVTEKITFVARALGGSIGPWGGEDVRLVDLFYKGGETIRGFDRAASARATCSRATRSAATRSGR